MRFRKETGDFSIKLNEQHTANVPKGLGADYLIGYLVEDPTDYGTNYSVIYSTGNGDIEGLVYCYTSDGMEYVYVKEAGVFMPSSEYDGETYDGGAIDVGGTGEPK